MTETLRERREKLNEFRRSIGSWPGHIKTSEEQVTEAVTRLIQFLYEPNVERGWVANRELITTLGFENEPINYGDLGCVEVKEFTDHTFLVLIEEADPQCSRFCAWVAEWLQKWGWAARVETEW